MLQHLFKLMWNKKKQHLLLVIEVFFSFLVIFALFSIGVNYYKNYRKPVGLVDKNVWVVQFSNGGDIAAPADSLLQFYHMIRQTVMSLPMVDQVSFCSFNIPFGNAENETGFNPGNNINVGTVYIYTVDDYYDKALSMQMLEGRWFGKEDEAAAHSPVIINQALEKKAYGDEPATGRLTGDEKDQHRGRVIGVVADTKTNGDYQAVMPAIWVRADTGFYHGVNTMLVKVSEDADAAVEGKLFKLLSNLMKKSDIGISHLSDIRATKNKQSIVPLIIFGIIALFLVVNVAFGLFGVLWYNINKRKSEIGLRRAVGASGGEVSNQLWVETLILATFGVVLGTFFAIQFPLLHVFNVSASVYVLALIFTILFVYVLVTFCSLYPGRQAAAIFPAEALHED